MPKLSDTHGYECSEFAPVSGLWLGHWRKLLTLFFILQAAEAMNAIVSHTEEFMLQRDMSDEDFDEQVCAKCCLGIVCAVVELSRN